MSSNPQAKALSNTLYRKRVVPARKGKACPYSRKVNKLIDLGKFLNFDEKGSNNG